MFTVVSASVFGTVIDWYDFLIYGSLTAVLAPIFFPSRDPAVGVIATLGVFGVGFAARPVGGLVFGMLADRIGRKIIFVFTIVLIGIATTCMGILPTYQQLGLVASALLVTLRFVQGFAFGGEATGSNTYLQEHAPDRKRCLYVSILVSSASLGTLMATVVILLLSFTLSASQMADYGWRIAFMLSLVLVVFGIVIRRKLGETPGFQKIKSEGKAVKTVAEGLKLDWKTMVYYIVGQGFPASILSYSASGTSPMIYMTAVMKPPISLNVASMLTVIFTLVSLPITYAFGYLSDRIQNRKKIYFPALMVCAVLLYPGYYLIGYGNSIGSLALMALGPLIAGFGYWASVGPQLTNPVEVFPIRVRQASWGIANGIALILGGFVPFIVTYFTYLAGGNFFIALAFPAIAGFCLPIIGILKMPESHGKMKE